MNKETNKIIIETILPFKPREIGVFGSYGRHEMLFDSDIDIMVNLDDNVSLLDLGGKSSLVAAHTYEGLEALRFFEVIRDTIPSLHKQISAVLKSPRFD